MYIYTHEWLNEYEFPIADRLRRVYCRNYNYIAISKDLLVNNTNR